MMNISFVTLKGTCLPNYAIAFKNILLECFKKYKAFIKENLYNDNFVY